MSYGINLHTVGGGYDGPTAFDKMSRPRKASGGATPGPSATAIPANIPNHQIRFTPYLSNAPSEPITAHFSCKAWAMSIRSKGSL